MAASIEEFAERGFNQVSLTDIARRAGVSGPAIYKHFDSKADLLMHAARQSLDQTLSAADTAGWSPRDTARRWLADDFAPTRRLLLELHLAAGRDADLGELLTDWHLERTRSWQAARRDSIDQIKAFYLLLMGLAHVDSLAAVRADPEALAGRVVLMVDALFPEPDGPTVRRPT